MSRCTARLLVLASFVGIGGCGGDQIVGRYKSVDCFSAGSWQSCSQLPVPTAAIAVSANSIATQPAATTSAGQLPERALAAAIKMFGSKPGVTADAIKKDIDALTHPENANAAGDQTLLHRTITVSVAKHRDFAPADRIYSTDVTLTLDHAIFTSWDALASIYNTINAGTIQFTQATTLSGGITAAIPVAPATITPSLTASQANTRQENFTASPQTEGLTAMIENDGKTLTIHRGGGNGLELAGNTSIKVDIQYTGQVDDTYIFSVESYFDKKKKPLPPNQLVVKRVPTATIPLNTAITAKIKADYSVWHVMKGDATYEERDDEVRKVDQSTQEIPFNLVSARDASPNGFALRRTDSSILHAQKTGYKSDELCFASYFEAVDFLAFLKNHKDEAHHVGDFDLQFERPPTHHIALSPSDVDSLYVRYGCL